MPIMSMEMALFNAYISLVKVLHAGKAIEVDRLIAEIGETMDFRRKHHLESAEEHENLKYIYDALVQIEPALTELARVKSQFRPPEGN
jgi:hypothetical protein